MKLHYHPVSTTSRPVLLFIQENQLPVELKVVDLMTGEHTQEPYSQLNPNQLVPLLEDEDFRLTESSAILKYLADKFESDLYPRDLQKRAKVNEAMDWLNTQLNRELCYGLVYPQVFPHHKRPSDATQDGTLAWSKERTQRWLSILDQHILGSQQRYLAGNELTIADYYATGFVSLGELIRVDYEQFPNLNRWFEQVKRELTSYAKVNEVFYGFAGSLKDQAFASL